MSNQIIQYINLLVGLEVIHSNHLSKPQLLLPLIQTRPHAPPNPKRLPILGRKLLSPFKPLRLLIQKEDVSVR